MFELYWWTYLLHSCAHTDTRLMDLKLRSSLKNVSRKLNTLLTYAFCRTSTTLFCDGCAQFIFFKDKLFHNSLANMAVNAKKYLSNHHTFLFSGLALYSWSMADKCLPSIKVLFFYKVALQFVSISTAIIIWNSLQAVIYLSMTRYQTYQIMKSFICKDFQVNSFYFIVVGVFLTNRKEPFLFHFSSHEKLATPILMCSLPHIFC